MGRMANVWYLGHSGFAVGFSDTLLVFDYYLDKPEGEFRSLSTGVISPPEISGKKVLVFSSHRHPDHFNPVILTWKDELPDAEYFLSSDIPRKFQREGHHILQPNHAYHYSGFDIQTLKSTDEGIAFLVSINGFNIYHAGDLNWWHWDEEPKAWNGDMEARYKREVSLLKDVPIDIAFLTADPRQENAELWGLKYFLDQVKVKAAFPMHFGDDTSIMERIDAQSHLHPSLRKTKRISARGDHFLLDL